MKPDIPKKRLVIYLVLSMLLITFVFYAYQIFFIPNILVDQGDKLFVIRSGATWRTLQEDLHKERVVNDLVSFSFLARLQNYDKEIKPGRYYLKSNMTNLQAIKALKAGRREPVKITFSHARQLSDLGEKITKNTGMTSSELLEAVDEFVKSNKDGFTRESALCLFIPNTYEVYFNVVPQEFIERMYDEYNKFWNADRREKAKSLGLTPIEVSILASIVQAETVKSEEAPVIAGLYLNRLKKDIALQADPTLIFAVGDFTIKRVLNEHKEVESPYNTYKYPGLPPGPINLPQIASIDAVLHFQQHNYYYMCAREDFSGYHNFASSLADHQVNARRYQRALTLELRKAQQGKQ